MRITFTTFLLAISLFFSSSCTQNRRDAKQYLMEAQNLYESGNFSLAKLKLDSIKILFPKAYDEIKSGMQLMQQVRMAENRRNIDFCDSMLVVNKEKIDRMLQQFSFSKDRDYQEFGIYYPKAYPYATSLNKSWLRAGVEEKGAMFIESVLVGHNIHHRQIKASTKNGEYAETLLVDSDGFNHRFSTLTGSYEIVRFQKNTENGIIQFIYTFQDKPITITFAGNKQTNITLSEAEKKAISQSFELSTLMLETEKLKFEKEKSETLIRYLQSKPE